MMTHEVGPTNPFGTLVGSLRQHAPSVTRLALDYQRPHDLRRATELLSVEGAQALGGGTDLLVTIREGLARPEQLVDLRGLPGIDTIQGTAGGGVRIGAAAGVAALAADQTIRERFPALAMACDSVGSPALRNMGTIAGSLCQRPRCWYFRSGIPCLKSTGSTCPAVDGQNRHLAILGGGPCHAVHGSDPAVALVALDATLLLEGPQGARSVPIAEFFVLPDPDPHRENVLLPGEFITAIVLPDGSSGGRQRYTKVLHRGAWDFALASIAVTHRLDGGVRLVLGGVAPVPWRVNPSVEEDVASAPLADDDLDALADRALYDARPLSDNDYKATLARTLLRDAMAFAAA